MSRRHAAVKRVVNPDTKYNSVLVTKFINHLMRDGKKSLAEKIVYNAFERIEKKHGAEAFKTFTEAMNNVKPYLEVTSVRVLWSRLISSILLLSLDSAISCLYTSDDIPSISPHNGRLPARAVVMPFMTIPLFLLYI